MGDPLMAHLELLIECVATDFVLVLCHFCGVSFFVE